MSPEILFMLVLVLVALAAFVKEIFPIEVTAMGVLAVLIVSGTVSAEDALTGFSSKAVVAIAGLFVMSHALMKTGVLELAAERLGERSRKRPWLGVGVLLCAVGVFSGFLNNTAMVAIAIPLVMKLCRRLELSPSKVLIPLSYASIFGGTLTLVGTSTNLLVSDVVEKAGVTPFTMFEFSSMGLVFLVCGLAYILIFGIGSVVGMTVLAVVVSLPLRWSVRSLTWAHNGLMMGLGVFTLGLGFVLLHQTTRALLYGVTGT